MKQTTKNIIGTLAVVLFLLGLLYTGCVVSCSRYEKERYAKLEPNGEILLVVKGRYRTLISPEGPCPKWSNALRIFLHPDKKISGPERQKLVFGEDFSTNGEEVKSGFIIIDHDRGVVEANIEYTESYSWMVVNGEFPIKRQR